MLEARDSTGCRIRASPWLRKLQQRSPDNWAGRGRGDECLRWEIDISASPETQKLFPVGPGPLADFWVFQKLLIFRLTTVMIMWTLIQALVVGCIVMIITTYCIFTFFKHPHIGDFFSRLHKHKHKKWQVSFSCRQELTCCWPGAPNNLISSQWNTANLLRNHTFQVLPLFLHVI